MLTVRIGPWKVKSSLSFTEMERKEKREGGGGEGRNAPTAYHNILTQTKARTITTNAYNASIDHAY